MKKALLFTLCALLLVQGIPAAARADDDTIILRTVDDWNALALSCVLDTRSEGMTVILEEDLDFTGTDFVPVPLFSGVFTGGGHKLSGISAGREMSPFGVFRQVMEGAVIDGLDVAAEFAMADSSDTVGGIAGRNAGTITGCSFEGTVSGKKCVGGICGINETGGTVDRCRVSGTVSGEHRAGGIAGENSGTVTGCENSGRVNASPIEISAGPAEIEDSTLSAEELIDITDIGGICGISSGAVLDCRNRGDIGYRHVGYNIGGIAGRLSGTVLLCENSGSVAGRKDVGGIAGQLDPDTAWDFSEGNLVTLRKMLDGLQGDISTLVSDIDGTGQVLSQNIRMVVDSLAGIGTAAGNFINDVSSWGMENLALSSEQINGLMADYMEQLALSRESARDSGAELPDMVIPDFSLLNDTELPDAPAADGADIAAGLTADGADIPDDLAAGDPEMPGLAGLAGDLAEEGTADGPVLPENPAQEFSSSAVEPEAFSDDAPEAFSDDAPEAFSDDASADDAPEESVPLVCDAIAFTDLPDGITDTVAEIIPEIIPGSIPGSIPDSISDMIQDLPDLPDLSGLPDLPGFTSDSPAVLADALRSAMNSVESLSTVFGDEKLTEDINNVSARLFSISDYILKMGGRGISASPDDYISDISLDEDGAGTGIVSGCGNHGAVSADTNAGGIVGAATIDFSFDRDDNFNLSSLLSGGAKYLIFAAVDSCVNTASVSAKKSTAGGIAGRMDYGAMTRCESCGDVSSSGEYAGGAAGFCRGVIQGCSVRSRISAERYLGGIAGYGHDISGCLVLPDFESTGGYQGAVAGFADGTVSQNYYSGCDVGGVNGFSFSGQAEPVLYEELIGIPENPDIFRTVTVTFIVDGEEYAAIDVPFGGSVGELPEVPDSDGGVWKWDPFDRDGICRSMSVEGRYVSPVTSLSSGEQFPKFIAEGIFREGQSLTVLPLGAGSVRTAEGRDILDAFTLTVDGYSDPLTVRMRETENGDLFVEDRSAGYIPAGYTRDGSYIVFTLDNGGSFCYAASESPSVPAAAYAAGGAVVLAAVLIPLIRRSKRGKRTSGESDAGNGTPDKE